MFQLSTAGIVFLQGILTGPTGEGLGMTVDGLPGGRCVAGSARVGQTAFFTRAGRDEAKCSVAEVARLSADPAPRRNSGEFRYGW
jgi:hypothetical protein